MCFNPRTPCGVRPISSILDSSFSRFQSTHSLRSATMLDIYPSPMDAVSIHALLAECDLCDGFFISLKNGFNPRTPCGVRPDKGPHIFVPYLFQSTHSLRSATQPTLYITTQQSKSYFAPTSLKRPSLHGYTF